VTQSPSLAARSVPSKRLLPFRSTIIAKSLSCYYVFKLIAAAAAAVRRATRNAKPSSSIYRKNQSIVFVITLIFKAFPHTRMETQRFDKNRSDDDGA